MRYIQPRWVTDLGFCIRFIMVSWCTSCPSNRESQVRVARVLSNSYTVPSNTRVILTPGVVLGRPLRITGLHSLWLLIILRTFAIVSVLVKWMSFGDLGSRRIVKRLRYKLPVLIISRINLSIIPVPWAALLFCPVTESNLNISTPLSYRHTGILWSVEFACAIHLPIHQVLIQSYSLNSWIEYNTALTLLRS